MHLGDILVVDNDETSQFIIKKIMGNMGRPEKLDFAGDTGQALSLLVENEYSLILLDVYQPRLGGLDLLEKMKAMRETGKSLPPVVMLTVEVSGHTEARLTEIMDRFDFVAGLLNKPFSEAHEAQLHSKIKRVPSPGTD